MNNIRSLYRDEKILLKIIFLFSLLFSFFFLIFLRHLGPIEHEVPGTDYFVLYKPMAQGLLQGYGIPLQKDAPTIAAPGYPVLFLLPVFALSRSLGLNELGVIVAFNTVLTAFSVCFLFLIAKKIFDKRIAFIAAILWSSYPLHLWLLKNPNTEVPFLLLFFAAVWVAIKAKRISALFLCGVLLGASILIRPIALFLPIMFAAFLFASPKNPLRASCSLLLGSLLILVPWIGYASFATGHFVPVASSGPHTVVYGLTFAFVGNGSHLKEMPQDVRMLMQRIKNAGVTSPTDVINFLLNETIVNPLSVIELLGLKALRSWYGTYEMWWEKEIALLQIPYLLSGVAGMFFAFKKFKPAPYPLSFLLAIIGYFWIMTFLTLSIFRYMLPAMGCMMIFSALTLSMIWDKTMNQARKKEL